MGRRELPEWPEAMATVLRCTYDMRAGRALAFGLPASKHFSIVYNYWADGELHEGQCFSATAIPQGSLFPIRYDPDEPRRSRHGQQAGSRRAVPLLAIGVAGSIVLSLGWLLFLHGCS